MAAGAAAGTGVSGAVHTVGVGGTLTLPAVLLLLLLLLPRTICGMGRWQQGWLMLRARPVCCMVAVGVHATDGCGDGQQWEGWLLPMASKHSTAMRSFKTQHSNATWEARDMYIWLCVPTCIA